MKLKFIPSEVKDGKMNTITEISQYLKLDSRVDAVWGDLLAQGESEMITIVVYINLKSWTKFWYMALPFMAQDFTARLKLLFLNVLPKEMQIRIVFTL